MTGRISKQQDVKECELRSDLQDDSDGPSALNSVSASFLEFG